MSDPGASQGYGTKLLNECHGGGSGASRGTSTVSLQDVEWAESEEHWSVSVR